jgi:glycosyltransferase involved in cell wall biosynthesis
VLKIGELASAHLPHKTIVVSKSLKQYYQERHGRATTYIPNGVNRVQRRPARGIRELGLKEGNYVLTVGRLVPEKDYHTLIQAFRQVKTDKRLVIAGGPSHTEEYVASLHEMAGNTPVVFTGYIHGRTLEELYSNAYLFMSASKMEGLPIALLEAMSFGTCPLVSDIPPHVEALDGLGYVFRTGDTSDLTTKLQALLDHPQKVMDTKDRLRRRVADVYNWDLVTDATEKVYKELLEKPG